MAVKDTLSVSVIYQHLARFDRLKFSDQVETKPSQTG